MTRNSESTAVSALASHSKPRDAGLWPVISRAVQAIGLGRAIWRTAVALVVCASIAGCAGGPTFAELFDDSAAGEGTGFQGAALVRAVVILARHQATPRQRAVAEQNAARAVAVLERQIAAERPKTTAKKTSPARKSSTTAKRSNGAKAKPSEKKLAAAPESEPEPEPTPTKAVKKLPARIAVRTVKDEKTAPGAEAAVMIYDVQARRIVGNEVYDIEDEPKPNETVKFDTSVVRYVGASY